DVVVVEDRWNDFFVRPALEDRADRSLENAATSSGRSDEDLRPRRNLGVRLHIYSEPPRTLPSVSILATCGKAFTPCFSNTAVISQPTLSAFAGSANAKIVGPAPLSAMPYIPGVRSARISSNPGMSDAR